MIGIIHILNIQNQNNSLKFYQFWNCNLFSDMEEAPFLLLFKIVSYISYRDDFLQKCINLPHVCSDLVSVVLFKKEFYH